MTTRVKTFHEIHEEGARRFGWHWHHANKWAIAAARESGVDYTDPKIKRVMSLIVLRLLVDADRAEVSA